MEIWKDIPGYQNYQVSNLGRVKSLKFNKEKILKQNLNKDYFRIFLSDKGKTRMFKIHQLVAIAFLDHKIDKHNKVIDHINGITTDNKLENLRIVTSRENTTFGRLKKNATSKYTGVNWHKNLNKWVARIGNKGKVKHIGYFDNEIEASEAYQKALQKIKNPLESLS